MKLAIIESRTLVVRTNFGEVTVSYPKYLDDDMIHSSNGKLKRVLKELLDGEINTTDMEMQILGITNMGLSNTLIECDKSDYKNTATL